MELVPIESLSVTASGSLIQTEGKTTPGRIYGGSDAAQCGFEHN